MKNQKTIRKLVSLVLCLAMAVSALSMFAFAEEPDAEEARAESTSSEYICGLCGGTAKWFPGGTITTTQTHPYFTYDSNGNATEHTCTVLVTTYYQGCTCTSCGTQLLENSYVVRMVHKNCGA